MKTMCSPKVIACVRLRAAVLARASCLEAFCWRELAPFLLSYGRYGKDDLRSPLWMPVESSEGLSAGNS